MRRTAFRSAAKRGASPSSLAAVVAAEVLEVRTLLSAFSLDGDSLDLSGFDADTNNVQIASDASHYLFSLGGSGTWSGTDGGGIVGAGSAVLTVDRTAVDGLANGISINAEQSGIYCVIDSADFASLSGGLSIVGDCNVLQYGDSLDVAALTLNVSSADFAGSIFGSTGNISIETSSNINFGAGSITTTSGDISLVGHGGQNVNASVDVRGTIETVSGAITLDGSGAGTWCGVSFSTIESTSATAGEIRIVGTNATVGVQVGSISSAGANVIIEGTATAAEGGVGVLFSDGTIVSIGDGAISITGSMNQHGGRGLWIIRGNISSNTGDITLRGEKPALDDGSVSKGVEIQDTTILSTGTDATAAKISIIGSVVGGFGYGVHIWGTSDIRSSYGDIDLQGTGESDGFEAWGVMSSGQIRSVGTGVGAANISISGIGGGHLAGDGIGAGGTISTIDGDLSITGTVTGSGINCRGVSLVGWMSASGGGNITITGTAGLGRLVNGAAVWGSDGVYLSDVTLHVKTGSLRIDGTGGCGNAAAGIWAGFGVQLSDGAKVTSETGPVQLIGSRRAELTSADGLGGVNLAYGSLLSPISVSSVGGSIEIVGDSLEFGSFASIQNLTGDVTLRTETAGRQIELGGSDTATALGLSDAELDRVLSNRLIIGDATAGSIRLVGSVTLGGDFTYRTLSLITGGAILDATSNESAVLTVDRLNVTARSIGRAGVADIDLAVANFTADVLTGIFFENRGPLILGSLAASQIKLVVHGVLTIDAAATLDLARLDLAAAFPGALRYELIDVASSSGVVGSILGLSEGANIGTINGRLATITYCGGDGNDIVVHVTSQTDIVGYSGGDWRVGVSTSTSFESSTWITWSDIPWEALKQGDFNGDRLTDVLGFSHGNWWVGLSNGSTFRTTKWGGWSDLAWQNVTVGDLDGDGDDDILARYHGAWWITLSNGSGFAVPERWSAWSDSVWKHVSLVDLDADGDADLLANLDGAWWVGLSNGDGFAAAKRWGSWQDVAWDAVGTLDANGDGRTDVYAFRRGTWYVGLSDGNSFSVGLRSNWKDAAWSDAIVGDFDGDGRDDVAARMSGAWWVNVSTDSGGAGTTTRWATWKDLDWQNVTVGDFDGDGRDDIAARSNFGWWVARSTGAGFETALWDTWRNVEWTAVAAVEASNPPVSSPTASLKSAQSASEHDVLASLWSLAEDDEFAAALLAV